MSYIIKIDDLEILFNEENKAFSFVLDHFITKIITINNIKINNKLFGELKFNFNDILIKKFNNFETFEYDIILFNFDNFTFYYENSNNIINYNSEKLNTLKKLFISYIGINQTQEQNVTLVDELCKENDSFLELDYSNEEIIKQQELIRKLNKKKELLEEINTKFNVDYELYFKIKSDFKEVPDIFKFKYEVFSEMENKNFINDKVLAKKYYTENYNRINKNIGSSIFSNIFFQTEKEENL